MFLGKVIGNVWATRKYDSLKSLKLLIVQPLNSEMKNNGEPFIAVDTVGSGVGELIFYVTASEAVLALPVDFAPVDASIVGIIDTLNSVKKP
ncbi:MAG: EutN/CcmL family microcompartment protein [Ignavibacteriaceae bacterium]|nr:EutN/CcmL family microcompartment protein [Ignavibacteriaceae bacterium]